MRRILRILYYLFVALSLLLCAATVAARASAQKQCRWATGNWPPRHFGVAWFTDGIALYYAPDFPATQTDGSVWVTSSRKTYQYVQPRHSFLGFHLSTEAINTHDLYVGVPYWFLLTATAAPAVWCAARLLFRKRRHGAGLCPTCGYDLRATPDRCPECGAIPRPVTR
jgi:hypothetical protein